LDGLKCWCSITKAPAQNPFSRYFRALKMLENGPAPLFIKRVRGTYVSTRRYNVFARFTQVAVTAVRVIMHRKKGGSACTFKRALITIFTLYPTNSRFLAGNFLSSVIAGKFNTEITLRTHCVLRTPYSISARE
jgi:hypothetical protein